VNTIVAIIQILLIPIAFISVGLFVAWIFRRRARATQSAPQRSSELTHLLLTELTQ